ncbi:hypothetical protein [Nesterenkonia flava]|uniref:Uncharacterized protein n=1 Tax=Nesterenkonia flava TaxID=469799 RepID=A0ABU1FRX9_9MICC|nr:hypothetical protein [Nesterenkonia flava]MDR5711414.1 hypothetical protein [Nesterenkonia flava]
MKTTLHRNEVRKVDGGYELVIQIDSETHDHLINETRKFREEWDKDTFVEDMAAVDLLLWCDRMYPRTD